MDSKLIDPHLDKIPADEIGEAELQARLHSAPRRGLSINDTVAHDANKSVGARGVGTSEIEAGPERDNPTETSDELLGLEK